jgi:P27 family predicted phage terminase small subunit
MARGRRPATGGLSGPSADVPEPEDLTVPVRGRWRKLVPLIAELCPLREQDADALRQYCEAADLRARAVRELDGEPLVITATNGSRQAHPLLKVISQAEAVMMKLSERFGLDPASRKRLQIAAQKADSPFLDYLKSGRKSH